jgi:hypothetical protein
MRVVLEHVVIDHAQPRYREGQATSAPFSADRREPTATVGEGGVGSTHVRFCRSPVRHEVARYEWFRRLEVRLDVEDVTPVSVLDRSPPWRAWRAIAGCEAQGKAQGRPFRPGVTGEGKTERVSVSEPVVMPRYGNSPGRVVMVGMMRSGPLRIGERRPRTDLRSCGHRCFRGRAGTRPGRISCVWNVETPSGPPHLGCGGRPTVREAEVRGGNRTPKKRMPAVERQQEPGSRLSPVLPPVGSRITGRIPGLVPGRESGLTCGG